jgi:hypothetical protein
VLLPACGAKVTRKVKENGLAVAWRLAWQERTVV